MFYNVENYFDTVDNSITRDGEFLPSAQKRWNGYRYYCKTINIFKTIAAVGGMRPPEIIGLAEIENDTVLKRLIWSTGLSKYPYGILHYDSPDLRGIDVGMLYRRDVLNLVSSRKFRIVFPENSGKRTRDILYGKFTYQEKDTFHIIVNHWPSRWGGKQKSAASRKYVASVLKQKVDSILQIDSCALIVIMGDLNDGPMDESVLKVLEAKQPVEKTECTSLYNLAYGQNTQEPGGTYRYKAQWDLFDQIIVSGSLLNSKHSSYTCSESMQIADLPFLLEEDTKYGGLKPKRTYFGPVYHGGFSDHLPVFLDIFVSPD